jgi:hypothetical protein
MSEHKLECVKETSICKTFYEDAGAKGFASSVRVIVWVRFVGIGERQVKVHQKVLTLQIKKCIRRPSGNPAFIVPRSRFETSAIKQR